MWASEPVKVRTPMIKAYGNQEFYKEVELDETPVYYAFNVRMDGDTRRSWVSLVPFDKGDTRDVIIYYDGIVLVEGERSLKIEPIFEDRNGNRGIWGGQPFENMIRNSSAETGWPHIWHWADVIGGKYLPDYTRPSWIMAMVADWPGAGWFFELTTKNLLRTFWAKFGWGHVALMGHKPYRILGVITALGLIGAIIELWRKRHSVDKGVILLFGITLIGVWGPTLIRGVNFIVLRPYIPVARYAYPAIIPTMIVLCMGWWMMLRGLARVLHIPDRGIFVSYFFLFFTLVVWSILSIFRYY